MMTVKDRKTARIEFRVYPRLKRAIEFEAIRRSVEKGEITTVTDVLTEALEKFVEALAHVRK